MKLCNLPICEYDANSIAIIQPQKEDYNFSLPDKCIAIFFGDVVKYLSTLSNVREIGRVTWETGDVVYYLYQDTDKEFCFYHSWVGAPISAAVMDLSIALGVKTIISIGGCGVLRKNLLNDTSEIVIPVEGIRDEGTSYHYIRPALTIKPSKVLVSSVKKYFGKNNIPYTCVKTWTTDGFYRETEERANRRKQQGCTVVEMEFTAMCAVAEKRGIDYAAIFYKGDSVEFGAYDERNWQNNHLLRNDLFTISKNIIIGDYNP